MFSWGQSAGWCGVLSGMIAVSLVAGIQAAEPEPAKAESRKNTDPLFPFTISKETTRITEPLKPDGTVDYAAALNARNSQGLTPKNNAGVLLMQAFGAEAVPEENREKFFKALGIPVPDEKGPLKDFGQFVEQHLKAQGTPSDDPDVYQPFWDQQSQAMSRPWSRKEFPLVADWVDANAEGLKLATEASQRSRLFIPIVVGEKETLRDASLEGVQRMRYVARLLTARAMLALEEGRIEESQNDLLTCHRLASLLGHRSTMIEVLISYALDAMACESDRALAEFEKVTQEQLAAYRQKLTELPALPRVSESIDQGERFFGLDVIGNLATQKMNGSELALPNAKLWKRVLGLSIDWDLIMTMFNEEYDNLAAALKLQSFAAREAEISKFGEKLHKLQQEANKPAQFVLMFLGVDPPRAVVSRQMGNVLLSLLIPAVRQVNEAETRAQTRRDLTIFALALAEYQREEGQYPEKLNDLSPNFLKAIPQDRFTDKPLKYQRGDKGYLLYSVGPNGKDDKGVSDGGKADDIAIRIPLEPGM